MLDESTKELGTPTRKDGESLIGCCMMGDRLPSLLSRRRASLEIWFPLLGEGAGVRANLANSDMDSATSLIVALQILMN